MRAVRVMTLALLLGAVVSPAPAAKPKPISTETRPIPAAEAPRIADAARRGALLYAYDQAAWHGTDDLREKLPGFEQKVGGWIVDGPAEAPQLVFIDRDEVDPHAVYVADFRGTKLVGSRVLAAGDDRNLSAPRKAMVFALRAAAKAMADASVQRCKPGPFNSVVLPPETAGGPIRVYFLTPQTTLSAVPFGGHYLVEVGADGRAGKPRAFTKSCLEMAFQPSEGATPAGIVVSHLLDPTPTEIHVFSSYAAGIPVFVMTQDGARTWVVDRSSIRLIAGTRR